MMFTIYETNTGRVIGHSIESPAVDSRFAVISGFAAIGKQYVKDNTIKDYPLNNQPQLFVFNLETEEWEDPSDLGDYIEAARDRINRDRDKFEFGGFAWNGNVFDSNAISQQRIQGAVQLSLVAQAAGVPFSIEWTLADNSVISLDGEQMLSVGLTLGQHIEAAHTKSRLLKNQLNQAQSKEQLDSVVW